MSIVLPGKASLIYPVKVVLDNSLLQIVCNAGIQYRHGPIRNDINIILPAIPSHAAYRAGLKMPRAPGITSYDYIFI